jgi:hypothetical protein
MDSYLFLFQNYLFNDLRTSLSLSLSLCDKILMMLPEIMAPQCANRMHHALAAGSTVFADRCICQNSFCRTLSSFSWNMLVRRASCCFCFSFQYWCYQWLLITRTGARVINKLFEIFHEQRNLILDRVFMAVLNMKWNLFFDIFSSKNNVQWLGLCKIFWKCISC